MFEVLVGCLGCEVKMFCYIGLKILCFDLWGNVGNFVEFIVNKVFLFVFVEGIGKGILYIVLLLLYDFVNF